MATTIPPRSITEVLPLIQALLEANPEIARYDILRHTAKGFSDEEESQKHHKPQIIVGLDGAVAAPPRNGGTDVFHTVAIQVQAGKAVDEEATVLPLVEQILDTLMGETWRLPNWSWLQPSEPLYARIPETEDTRTKYQISFGVLVRRLARNPIS